MKLLRTLYADGSRWFMRKSFLLGIMGIFLVNHLIMFQNTEELQETTVFSVFWIYQRDDFFIINYIIAAIVFAGAFCDEEEHNYYRFIQKRCDRATYVFSKTIHAFLSAFSTLLFGCLLWLVSLRLFMPWIDYSSDAYTSAIRCGMGSLLIEHRIFLYFILNYMGIGMIAGILSVISLAMSVYSPDRCIVLALPTVLDHLINAYIGDISDAVYQWCPEELLYFNFTQSASASLTFLRGVGYSICFLFVFGGIAYWGLRRKDCA